MVDWLAYLAGGSIVILGAYIVLRYPFVGILLLYTFMFIDTRDYVWFKNLEKIILFASFGSALLHSLSKRQINRELKLFVPLLIFIILSLISMWVNTLPLRDFFAFVYGEGKMFILLYVFLLYPLSERQTKFCLWCLLIVPLFQIPFLFQQAIASGFAMPQRGYADYYIGTVGEGFNFKLAICGVAMFGVCLIIMMKNWPRRKAVFFAAIFYFLSLILITDSKTLLVIIVVVTSLFFALKDRWHAVKQISIYKQFLSTKVILTISFSAIIVALFLFAVPDTKEELYTWDWFKLADTTNIRVYQELWDLNTAKFSYFLFGQGPAQTMSTVAASSMSSFYFSVVARTWNQENINLSISGSGKSTFGAFWGDLGFSGVLFYGVCLYFLFNFISIAEQNFTSSFSKLVVRIAQYLFLYLIIWGVVGPSFENWLILVPFGVCLGYIKRYSSGESGVSDKVISQRGNTTV